MESHSLLKLTLRAGSVYYFQERKLTSPEPHYFIVVNQEPFSRQLLVLTVVSSKVDNVKRLRQGLPGTLVEIGPKDYDELKEVVENGWAFSWWCGDKTCEAKVKEDTHATTRCIPLEQPGGKGKCIVCGKEATEKVYFAKSY